MGLALLPYGVAGSDGVFHQTENDISSTTTVPSILTPLGILIALGILFIVIAYLVEFWKTYDSYVPNPEPILPISNHHLNPATNDLDKDDVFSRDFSLHAAAIVWCVLSVGAIGMTGVFRHPTSSSESCEPLDINPDIAGMGVRVSLCVSGAIVVVIASLGHFHAEETGVKAISVALLGVQICYAWNLVTKQMPAIDMLIGAMILDGLTSITAATFSMKEFLAARQLVRMGHLVQLFALVALAMVVRKLGRAGTSEAGDSGCSCFQAYWWGPVDTCQGASPTFWMYFTLKAITFSHGFWLCWWHMGNYDAAEKSGRDDTNTNIDIPKTVYDSIPATAFTKYQEWISISIASVASIELALARAGSQGAGDVGSWGQTAQLLLTAVTFVCWFYGLYSMFKEKNVKRRQDVLNQSSIGSLVPELYTSRPAMWGTWIGQIPRIAREDHPFDKLPLRATNHARMRHERAWVTILNDFRQWPNEDAQSLGVMLIKAATQGDTVLVGYLLKEKASVTEVDEEENTALMKAAENDHVGVVMLLLKNGACVAARNGDGVTALSLALRENSAEVVDLLLGETTKEMVLASQEFRWPLLHTAIEASNTKAVRVMLERGADVMAWDNNGETALGLALDTKRTEVVDLLLGGVTKEMVLASHKFGRTPLHVAVGAGDTKAVRVMLERGADVMARDENGETVFNFTSSTEIVDLLLGGVTKETALASHESGWTLLHAAALADNKKAVEMMLERGADVTARDEDGNTALGLALATKRTEVVDLLLGGVTKEMVLASQEFRSPLLYNAVYAGNIRAVEVMLERGANIMARGWWGLTTLGLAFSNCNSIDIFSKKNSTEIMDLLLRGVTREMVLASDTNGRTLLHAAVSAGNIKAVEVMLERGADIMAQDEDGETALDLAFKQNNTTDVVIKNSTEVVDLLLRGVTREIVLASDTNGRTLLHAAVSADNTEAVGVMLERGANIIARDKDGWTALDLAFKKHSTEEVVDLLLGGITREMVLASDRNGWPLLHAAVSAGNIKAVEVMLERGANIMAHHEDGETALDLAFKNNRVEVVDLLLRGVTREMVLESCAGGRTLLHAAVSAGNIKAVRVILERGADVIARNEYEDTAIDLASKGGDTEMVNLLEGPTRAREGKKRLHAAVRSCNGVAMRVFIGRDIDITARDEDGLIVFDFAFKKGDTKMMNLLNKTIRARDEKGRTMLHTAAFRGHEEAAKILLEKGIDVTAQNRYGSTALHVALVSGQEKIVNLLMEKITGGDILLQNKLGWSVLHTAASVGNISAVRLLLERGADASMLNSSGKTAGRLAIENGHESTAILLNGRLGLSEFKCKFEINVTAVEGFVLRFGIGLWMDDRFRNRKIPGTVKVG